MAGAHWRGRTGSAVLGGSTVLLTACGLLVHRFTGRSYPHRGLPAPPAPGLLPEDIDVALAEAGEAFDVSRKDLLALLPRAETHADRRRQRAIGTKIATPVAKTS